MKNLLIIFISVLLLASCSTTKTFNKGPFQKRKYTKGLYFNKKNTFSAKPSNLTAVKSRIKPEIAAVSFSKQQAKQPITSDSVKITLKNGEVYQGIVKEDTEEGVLLQVKDARVIYLLKSDIAETVVLQKSDKNINPHEESLKKKETNTEALTIVLKNGKEFKGKITISNRKEYKVLTPSGERIYVKKQKVKDVYKPNNVKKEVLHSSSVASLVLFWLGLLTFVIGIGFLLLLIGYILSVNGFKKAELSPQTYNYKRAKRVKKMYHVLGGIFLALFLWILILLASWL